MPSLRDRVEAPSVIDVRRDTTQRPAGEVGVRQRGSRRSVRGGCSTNGGFADSTRFDGWSVTARASSTTTHRRRWKEKARTQLQRALWCFATQISARRVVMEFDEALARKTSLPLQAPDGLSDDQARDWYRERNYVVCPIVVITTVNKEGTPNAAVKTHFMTVSSMTRYAFDCSPEHHTYQNIIETGEFVINVPTEDILGKVLKAAIITENPSPAGSNEIESAGLTPIPSEKVRPPRVKECAAHYECLLDWYKEGLIVGKVVAVSVDKALADRTDNRKMVVVGGGRTPDLYGVVSETKRWPKVA